MDSTSSTRLWRTCKASGRPFPTVSDDDVLDFMVMEAVTLKVQAEDAAAAKKAEQEREKKEWKSNIDHLKN